MVIELDLATYIFEVELIEHDLKVDECFVLLEHGFEVFADVCVEVVVGDVQAEETLVGP